MRLSCFLPIKQKSNRAPGKNTNPIGSMSLGLTELKINQLLRADCFEEIVVSTDDPRVLEHVSNVAQSESRIRPVKRQAYLCEDETSLSALVRHAGEECRGNTILWTHTTSPFTKSKNYEDAVSSYREGLELGYDSLISVNEEQKYANFMGKALNYGGADYWPKTQNLEPVVFVNSAIFIASKDTYLTRNNRVGEKPIMFKSIGLDGFDVDTLNDWQVANSLLSGAPLMKSFL